MIIPSFSSRLPAALTPNRIAEAVRRRRASGRGLIDLTVSNPTAAGFAYPEGLLAGLSDARNLAYEPEAAGMPAAREAVAAEMSSRGTAVAPGAIVLTASTSEAYGYLFKLLCDPGDEVLVPQPSYPLFEWLTRLESVTAVPYRLEYEGRWRVDAGSVAAGLTPRTRAVLAVNPNNPTGSYCTREDLAGLAAAAPGVPIIGDEVFWDFPLPAAPAGRASVLESGHPLVFALGGLSKSAALPQLKLGWIAIGGTPSNIAAAREKLELIADTYLSVSTPVQTSAASLIASGEAIRQQILERARRNLQALAALVARHPALNLLMAEGGWSAIVRVPAVTTEEDLVVALAEQDGVLVHPGYFFDFAHEAFLVVSLIVEPALFDEGVARLARRIA
ncbi:MAG TPA: pyridoxal phosphate-dependent aminotransferase [Vicinamibacterales bacterium]|nr:pyridoxal phosphate-dependent aminotransferase [Vicinamibacterales bacterium]